MNDGWYILKVISGRETKIVNTILERIKEHNIEDGSVELSAPSYDLVTLHKGKKIKRNKSVFPGYIMIKTTLNNQILEIIRSISGVLGFINENGNPIALREKDIAKFTSGATNNANKIETNVLYEIGQKVKIISGPFASFFGIVDSIDQNKQRLKVAVTIFGRPTPVDLDITQVEEIEE